MPTQNRRTHLVGLSSVKELSSTRLRAWAAAALIAYGAVVVALTMLKAFFVIGMLWRPEAQRNPEH